MKRDLYRFAKARRDNRNIILICNDNIINKYDKLKTNKRVNR